MPRIHITDELRNRITDYCDNHGVETLAKSLGVRRNTVYRWMSSTFKSMDEANLDAVNRIIPPRHDTSQVSIPKRHTPSTAIPLIGSAKAANWESSLQSWESYIADAQDELYQIPGAKEGDFCVMVEGMSMAPHYLNGDILICTDARPYPARHEKVVAIMADGIVVVKRYERKDNTVRLLSLNEAEGVNYEWSTKDILSAPNYAVRMFPVRRAIIDEETHAHYEATQ